MPNMFFRLTNNSFTTYTLRNMEQLTNELHERATQLFEEGKYSEAEPLLRNIISANPGYADVHNKLGMIFHLKGDFQTGCSIFKRALDINPNYTEASLNLVIAYTDMGEFKKARQVLPCRPEGASDACGY